MIVTAADNRQYDSLRLGTLTDDPDSFVLWLGEMSDVLVVERLASALRASPDARAQSPVKQLVDFEMTEEVGHYNRRTIVCVDCQRHGC